jgi:hypothetical protein
MRANIIVFISAKKVIVMPDNVNRYCIARGSRRVRGKTARHCDVSFYCAKVSKRTRGKISMGTMRILVIAAGFFVLFGTGAKADNAIDEIQQTLKKQAHSPNNINIKYNKALDVVHTLPGTGNTALRGALSGQTITVYTVAFQQCGLDFQCEAQVATKKSDKSTHVDIGACRVKGQNAKWDAVNGGINGSGTSGGLVASQSFPPNGATPSNQNQPAPAVAK